MRAHHPRRPVRLVAVLLAVVLVVVAAAVVLPRVLRQGDGLAGQASVSTSSSAIGSSPGQTVTTDRRDDPARGWRSASETVGAWIELGWSRPVELRRLVLERNPLDEPGITQGYLTFGDGSQVQVSLSATERSTVVPVTPRTVDRVRFTVSALSPGAREAALTHLQVSDEPTDGDVATTTDPDGDVARAATLTGSAADPGELGALVDGDADGPGAAWTVSEPVGRWVQLDWPEPRELASVALAGGLGSAELRSATLTFGDGSTLPLGAVLTDSRRPTVLGFMPKVTRSLRLTLDAVSADGAVALAELAVYQVGAPAQTVNGGAQATARDDALDCNRPLGRPSDETGLVVRCPTTGAVVQGRVDVSVVLAPSFVGANATVWSSEPTAATPGIVQATPDAQGVASFSLDVDQVPAGPFTVRLEATSATLAPVSVLFQLYRAADGPVEEVASSDAAHGRTLVFREEFDRPVALSRTGADADYAAGKPGVTGVEDFGFGIFADPAAGYGTVAVVDDRYLRIRVQPRPADFPDPQGWGREHLAGLLASARPGGSGVAAQYGYFEARMAVPAAAGTWPAFWLLPTTNLVAAQPVVAEIDAVELYGHNPTGACHTIHEHGGDADAGGGARCGERWDTRQEAMQWHTYGVDVAPTQVTYVIDGRVVASTPQVQGGDAPMFFLVDLALGGGWPIAMAGVQDRADLYVDYVRVYV